MSLNTAVVNHHLDQALSSPLFRKAERQSRFLRFVVDAVLWVDTRQAAATDDLSLTVDYGAVAGQLAAVVSGEPVALIETLADRLAATCLSGHEAVREVEITVHKPHAPLVQSVRDVTVTIRRSRA